MKKRIVATCLLILFIFAALIYFTTLTRFSLRNSLAHAQGPWTVAFSNTGLGGDATGNLVTLIVTNDPSYSGPNQIAVPSGSITVDGGAIVAYTFVNPVVSNNAG